MSTIRVHDWEQAVAALTAARELGRPATLLSPQLSQAGIGWWRELVRRARRDFPEVAFQAVADCGPSAGLALAAIRDGVGPVAVAVNRDVLDKLADIARQAGTLATEGGKPALDLAGMSDAPRRCRDVMAEKDVVPST